MQNALLTPTPFIGRHHEIDEILTLLDDPSCRLLTLVGPGGIGKTRLALEVMSRTEDLFHDGSYFVPLAPLTRTYDILVAIADATPFCFDKNMRDAREQFFDYLREKDNKRLLLVLDNFEHLLDGVDVVSEILAITSGLKIIVTSREALNLQEEWVRQISGMAYPDHINGKSLEDYGAVQLFVDRARRIRGDFDLSEDSRSVVEICRLVDGMPLAIELAVGWLKTLQPADIVQEIQHNMDILATRSRNLPERHRSIRSVFSHSWRLMSDDERALFQKLAVFRGGFTREAAEVVAGASLHTLAGLVDKSLVRLSAGGRYDVHELLRQYAEEQLEVAHETLNVQRAYIEYYLGTLHRLERDVKSQRQIVALNVVEADFENIRNAWQLAVQQQHFVALGQAVESLHFFGDMRGRYYEMVPLLQMAVEQLPKTNNPDHEAIQARIQARLIRLILLGNLRIEIDLRSRIDDCLHLARARGDKAEEGFCLLVSGIVAIWERTQGHPCIDEEAAAIFRQCYAVNDALDDAFYKAEALAWEASTTESEDDASSDMLNQSLALRREIGDYNGIAWITLNLTEVALGQFDYVACERYAREALALMREIGSLKGVLESSFKLATTTMLKGDLAEARILAEEMRDLADDTNSFGGKMQAAGFQAFLICVMEEAYAEGAALARKNYVMSLEPFFGGHKDLGTNWGQAIANSGLGHHEAVRASYSDLFTHWHNDSVPGTFCLVLEAVACANDGNLEEAAELLGLAFQQPVWASGWLHHWALLKRLRADLERQLGIEAYQAAWERGCASNLSSVVNAILRGAPDEPQLSANQSLLEPLSERELEVLGLIAEGLSNRDIAEQLVLSVGTVKVHTRNIYGKLNVSGRTQALAQAAKFNLLQRLS